MKPLFQNTLMIGVGLIGASLSRDLLEKNLSRNVFGFDTNPSNIRLASSKGYVNGVHKKLDEALKKFDLIVLATPISAINETLKKIAPFVDEKTIVMDVGSTKVSIMKVAENLFSKGNFVGAHPMAGTEKSGAKASLPHFFENKTVILLKTKHTKKCYFDLVEKLWKRLGSVPVTSPREKHDEILAYISHLPHAVSFGFALTVAGKLSAKEAQKYCGAGFKDTSRIAASDFKMWRDIFYDNKKYLLKSLKEMNDYLKKFEHAITHENDKELESLILKAAQFRRKIK